MTNMDQVLLRLESWKSEYLSSRTEKEKNTPARKRQESLILEIIFCKILEILSIRKAPEMNNMMFKKFSWYIWNELKIVDELESKLSSSPNEVSSTTPTTATIKSISNYYLPVYFLIGSIFFHCSKAHFRLVFESFFEIYSNYLNDFLSNKKQVLGSEEPVFLQKVLCCFSFVKLNLYPFDLLEESSYLLYTLHKYYHILFQDSYSKAPEFYTIKNYWLECIHTLLSEIIPYIGAEVNVRSWVKAIDINHEKISHLVFNYSPRFSSQYKHLAISYSLLSLLLCTNKREVFEKKWFTYAEYLLKQYVKESSSSLLSPSSLHKPNNLKRIIWGSIIKLVWMYLYRYPESYSEVSSKLLLVLKTFYHVSPSESKKLYCNYNEPSPYWHIRTWCIMGVKNIELLNNLILKEMFIGENECFVSMHQWLSNLESLFSPHIAGQSPSNINDNVPSTISKDCLLGQKCYIFMKAYMLILHHFINDTTPDFPKENIHDSPFNIYLPFKLNASKSREMDFFDTISRNKHEWSRIDVAFTDVHSLKAYIGWFQQTNFIKQDIFCKFFSSVLKFITHHVESIIVRIIEYSEYMESVSTDVICQNGNELLYIDTPLSLMNDVFGDRSKRKPVSWSRLSTNANGIWIFYQEYIATLIHLIPLLIIHIKYGLEYSQTKFSSSSSSDHVSSSPSHVRTSSKVAVPLSFTTTSNDPSLGIETPPTHTISYTCDKRQQQLLKILILSAMIPPTYAISKNAKNAIKSIIQFSHYELAYPIEAEAAQKIHWTTHLLSLLESLLESHYVMHHNKLPSILSVYQFILSTFSQDKELNLNQDQLKIIVKRALLCLLSPTPQLRQLGISLLSWMDTSIARSRQLCETHFAYNVYKHIHCILNEKLPGDEHSCLKDYMNRPFKSYSRIDDTSRYFIQRLCDFNSAPFLSGIEKTLFIEILVDVFERSIFRLHYVYPLLLKNISTKADALEMEKNHEGSSGLLRYHNRSASSTSFSLLKLPDKGHNVKKSLSSLSLLSSDKRQVKRTQSMSELDLLYCNGIQVDWQLKEEIKAQLLTVYDLLLCDLQVAFCTINALLKSTESKEKDVFISNLVSSVTILLQFLYEMKSDSWVSSEQSIEDLQHSNKFSLKEAHAFYKGLDEYHEFHKSILSLTKINTMLPKDIRKEVFCAFKLITSDYLESFLDLYVSLTQSPTIQFINEASYYLSTVQIEKLNICEVKKLLDWVSLLNSISCSTIIMSYRKHSGSNILNYFSNTLHLLFTFQKIQVDVEEAHVYDFQRIMIRTEYFLLLKKFIDVLFRIKSDRRNSSEEICDFNDLLCQKEHCLCEVRKDFLTFIYKFLPKNQLYEIYWYLHSQIAFLNDSIFLSLYFPASINEQSSLGEYLITEKARYVKALKQSVLALLKLFEYREIVGLAVHGFCSSSSNDSSKVSFTVDGHTVAFSEVPQSSHEGGGEVNSSSARHLESKISLLPKAPENKYETPVLSSPSRRSLSSIDVLSSFTSMPSTPPVNVSISSKIPKFKHARQPYPLEEKTSHTVYDNKNLRFKNELLSKAQPSNKSQQDLNHFVAPTNRLLAVKPDSRSTHRSKNEAGSLGHSPVPDFKSIILSSKSKSSTTTGLGTISTPKGKLSTLLHKYSPLKDIGLSRNNSDSHHEPCENAATKILFSTTTSNEDITFSFKDENGDLEWLFSYFSTGFKAFFDKDLKEEAMSCCISLLTHACPWHTLNYCNFPETSLKEEPEICVNLWTDIKATVWYFIRDIIEENNKATNTLQSLDILLTFIDIVKKAMGLILSNQSWSLKNRMSFFFKPISLSLDNERGCFKKNYRNLIYDQHISMDYQAYHDNVKLTLFMKWGIEWLLIFLYMNHNMSHVKVLYRYKESEFQRLISIEKSIFTCLGTLFKILGHHLSEIKDPYQLNRSQMNHIYPTQDKPIVVLFDMLTSHSECLKLSFIKCFLNEYVGWIYPSVWRYIIHFSEMSTMSFSGASSSTMLMHEGNVCLFDWIKKEENCSRIKERIKWDFIYLFLKEALHSRKQHKEYFCKNLIYCIFYLTLIQFSFLSTRTSIKDLIESDQNYDENDDHMMRVWDEIIKALGLEYMLNWFLEDIILKKMDYAGWHYLFLPILYIIKAHCSKDSFEEQGNSFFIMSSPLLKPESFFITVNETLLNKSPTESSTSSEVDIAEFDELKVCASCFRFSLDQEQDAFNAVIDQSQSLVDFSFPIFFAQKSQASYGIIYLITALTIENERMRILAQRGALIDWMWFDDYKISLIYYALIYIGMGYYKKHSVLLFMLAFNFVKNLFKVLKEQDIVLLYENMFTDMLEDANSNALVSDLFFYRETFDHLDDEVKLRIRSFYHLWINTLESVLPHQTCQFISKGVSKLCLEFSAMYHKYSLQEEHQRLPQLNNNNTLLFDVLKKFLIMEENG